MTYHMIIPIEENSKNLKIKRQSLLPFSWVSETPKDNFLVISELGKQTVSIQKWTVSFLSFHNEFHFSLGTKIFEPLYISPVRWGQSGVNSLTYSLRE